MSRRATAIGASAIVVWSTLALLTQFTAGVPPLELTAITFAIGGGAGLAWIAARGRQRLLRQPARVWMLGVAGLFCYHALYFAALKLAPPAEAGLLNYLWPLLIVLFSAALPGERLRPRHIVGACLGFAALCVLAIDRLSPQAHPLDASAWLGFGCALAAAIVWAGYSVASSRLVGTPSDAVAGFCLATAALAALSHVAFEPTVWPTGATQWLAIVALGLGPVGAAFYAWDHGMKHGDLRLIAIASYATPILSTALLIAAGYGRAGASILVACGLIVAGAAVGARRNGDDAAP